MSVFKSKGWLGIGAGLALSVLIVIFLSPLSSKLPDGLQWVFETVGVSSGHSPSATGQLPEAKKSPTTPILAIAGLVLVVALLGLTAALLRKRRP